MQRYANKTKRYELERFKFEVSSTVLCCVAITKVNKTVTQSNTTQNLGYVCIGSIFYTSLAQRDEGFRANLRVVEVSTVIITVEQIRHDIYNFRGKI